MKQHWRSFPVIFLGIMIFLTGGIFPGSTQKLLADMEQEEQIPLIQVGNQFPKTELVSPKEKIYRDYLGLPDKPGFYLDEIKADVLIVEFLNKYCYHCQMQAYLMNRIYKTIKKDPALSGKVKILGIGVGNNRMELEGFRQEKRIPFPLIPDKNFVAFEDIGYPPGTPFALILKKEGGHFIVKNTHLGLITSRKAYMETIRKILGGETITAPQKVYQSTYKSLKPGVTRDQIKALIEKRLKGNDMTPMEITQLQINGVQQVFMIKFKKGGKVDVWFAALGSEGKVCDVCHDIFFLYLFDRLGTIRDFIPIYVTKYGNKLFEQKDVEKTRKALVGKNLTRPIQYNPQTDAVTSASMTSALIFKSVQRGQKLYEILKKEGYTQ